MDNGLLLCNTISKIMLFEELSKTKMDKDVMIKLKFEKDINSTICVIDCYKNYILIGDPYKLVNLYLYSPKSNKLVLLARDPR